MSFSDAMTFNPIIGNNNNVCSCLSNFIYQQMSNGGQNHESCITAPEVFRASGNAVKKTIFSKQIRMIFKV